MHDEIGMLGHGIGTANSYRWEHRMQPCPVYKNPQDENSPKQSVVQQQEIIMVSKARV